MPTKNPELKLKYWKKYNSREDVKLRRHESYMENREEVLKKHKEYRDKNKDRLNKRRIEKRERFNERVYNYYGGHCFICHTSERCYEIYDGHHVDPAEKEKGLSRLVTADWETIVVPELEKCVYLCSNCHKKLHNHRFDKDIKSGKLILIPGRRE